MQKQVIKCLMGLCPNAAEGILYKAVGYILESAPDAWIQQRLPLLNDTYGFTIILKEHDFWQQADEETRKKIVRLLGNKQPEKNLINFQNRVHELGADLPPPQHIMDILITAIQNGQRPDYRGRIRVTFPAGTIVNMQLGGDFDVIAGDLVELTNEWLSVQKFLYSFPPPAILPLTRVCNNGHPGQLVQVEFMATLSYTYPSDNADFQRELEGTFTPQDEQPQMGNGVTVNANGLTGEQLQTRIQHELDHRLTPPMPTNGILHTIADAAQVPENVLRGSQPGIVLGEDHIRYLMSNVRMVIGSIPFDEVILRNFVYQAFAQVQAEHPHENVGIVPMIVQRAVELYQAYLRRITPHVVNDFNSI